MREIAYYQNRAAKVPRREEFNIQLTHSNAVHVVVAKVDVATGFVTLPKYVIVHDCGRQLNPGIVKGMVIGSTVHGIGTALYEEFLYSPEGQLLTGTFIRDEGDAIAIGALVAYAELKASALLRARCALLPQAASVVGDVQVRNRGTIGGALAHADPAGDMCAAVLALDARLKLVSTRGERWVGAGDFFVGMYTSALEPDEVLAGRGGRR